MAISQPLTRDALEALALDGIVPKNADVMMIDALEAVDAFRGVELADNAAEAGVQYPASAGNRCFGVTLTSAASGDQVPVQLNGLGKIELGATLTAPDQLSVDVDGQFIAATTGHLVAAQLLEDGVATDVVSAKIVYGESHA